MLSAEGRNKKITHNNIYSLLVRTVIVLSESSVKHQHTLVEEKASQLMENVWVKKTTHHIFLTTYFILVW